MDVQPRVFILALYVPTRARQVVSLACHVSIYPHLYLCVIIFYNFGTWLELGSLYTERKNQIPLHNHKTQLTKQGEKDDQFTLFTHNAMM